MILVRNITTGHEVWLDEKRVLVVRHHRDSETTDLYDIKSKKEISVPFDTLVERL